MTAIPSRLKDKLSAQDVARFGRRRHRDCNGDRRHRKSSRTAQAILLEVAQPLQVTGANQEKGRRDDAARMLAADWIGLEIAGVSVDEQNEKGF